MLPHGGKKINGVRATKQLIQENFIKCVKVFIYFLILLKIYVKLVLGILEYAALAYIHIYIF